MSAKWFVCILWVFLVPLVQAQSTPEIITFSSSVTSVTPDEAESGVYETVLNWQVDNLDVSESIMLQALVLGDWIDILPNVNLPVSGERVHIVPHTLTLAPPTMRLVVLDASNQVIVSQELLIPYIEDEEDSIINALAIDSPDVRASDLLSGDAIVPVSWMVAHRPPNTNLVFEQVLLDGTVQNIELPREFLWIRSSGQGSVRPIYEAGIEQVDILLSLINTQTGAVYASETASLTVIDDLTPAPNNSPAPRITFFSANVMTALRGETITLSWTTRNATTVWVEYWEAGTSPINSGGCFVVDATYDNLPLTGSLDVMIPPQYEGNGIRFNLVLDDYGCQSRGVSQAVDVEIVPDAVTTDPEIVYFTMDRETVTRGETLTLAWATENARNVWVEYWEAGTSPVNSGSCFVVDVTYDNLPLTGSLDVMIPPQYEGNGIRFNLVLDDYGCQSRGISQAVDVEIIE